MERIPGAARLLAGCRRLRHRPDAAHDGPARSAGRAVQRPWGVALLLPAFYSLGCAAVLFAAEREKGTAEFLRVMSARPSRVFAAKIAFSILSTMAIIGLLWGAAALLTLGHRREFQAVFGERTLPVICLTVEFLAWGYLCSALCRKVLTAVCLSAVVALLFKLAVHEILSTGFHINDSGYEDLFAVVPLLAASYVATWRMLEGAVREWSLPQMRFFPRAVGGFKWLTAQDEAARGGNARFCDCCGSKLGTRSRSGRSYGSVPSSCWCSWRRGLRESGSTPEC